MATTTKRWVAVQDVFDELEFEETDRLARMLSHWVDEPAYAPVTRDDEDEPRRAGRPSKDRK